MADAIDKRMDIEKFDKATIDQISSDIVRALTEIAEDNPDAKGKFHIKIPHIKGTFSRKGHTEIIIGASDAEEPGAGDQG